jgi:hypothetical protein
VTIPLDRNRSHVLEYKNYVMGSCARGARPFFFGAGLRPAIPSVEDALRSGEAFATGAEKETMMKSPKWAAPRGTFAWGAEQILQLLERDENRKGRLQQTVQTQNPEIESEQLAPPPPDPDRFPSGMWQHSSEADRARSAICKGRSHF